MKKENIEKIAKVVAEEYGVSDGVGYYLADKAMIGLETALENVSLHLIVRMIDGDVHLVE